MVAVEDHFPLSFLSSARSYIQSSHASIYPFRQIHSRLATERRLMSYPRLLSPHFHRFPACMPVFLCLLLYYYSLVISDFGPSLFEGFEKESFSTCLLHALKINGVGFVMKRKPIRTNGKQRSKTNNIKSFQVLVLFFHLTPPTHICCVQNSNLKFC